MPKVVPPRPVSKSIVPSTHTSFTSIKSPKCLGQCNHIRAKHVLVCRSKRLSLVDDKRKHPEEMGFGKLLPNSKGTTSEVVAQNGDEVALPYHQDSVCSQTIVP
ncbi:unnamed protein product [Hymenolepis diminuta]|uniref:Uncharacterized protein n=1 Tax=Hymenolepis diminuta TaxID=6216 RepID=A0A564YXQ3_HYMDI|nr:unnamed protein product [Hymenolepis diminuta]